MKEKHKSKLFSKHRVSSKLYNIKSFCPFCIKYNIINKIRMLGSKYFLSMMLILMFFLSVQGKSIQQEIDDQLSQHIIQQQSSDNSPFAVFWGFVLGPALFFFSFVMTWYNEKRAAVNHRRIKKISQILCEKQKSTINKSQTNINQKLIVNESDRSNKDVQKMQDKLIYVSGQVKVNGPAMDDVSKFTHPLAVKIQRFVQVREYRAKDDNKKKKHHQPPELQWCIFHFSEAGDKLNNPESWFIKTQDFQAQEAYVDGYKMNSNQILNIPASERVIPTQQMAQEIVENKKNLFGFIIQDNYIYFPATKGSKLSQGTLRVSYFIAKSPTYSIIAQEGLNKNLQPFRIDIFENHGHPDTLFCEDNSACGCCHAAGTLFKPITQLDIVYEGKVIPDDMIKRSLKKNSTQTVVIRLLCFLCMVFGIYLFFLPIVELIGYIPLVGNFLSGAAGAFIFLGALIVCIPLFLGTMALAWLFYHPKIGIALIIVAVVIAAIVLIVEETVK